MIGRFFGIILTCLLLLIAGGNCANSTETPILAAHTEPLNIISCGDKSWTVTTLNSQEVTFLAHNCKQTGRIPTIMTLRIIGEIAKDKLLLLENYQALVKNQKAQGWIVLDSPGGDLLIAMQMGEIIWKNNWTVHVNNVCLSACVLVYAAGTSRYLHGGQLGVHRPIYMDDAVDDENTFTARYDDIFSKIQIYLDRFGVSRQIVELMRSTPSTKIRLLNEQEQLDWGLGMENVAEEEMRRQRIRKGCGREFEKRYYIAQSMIEQECGLFFDMDMDKWSSCYNQINKQYSVESLRCVSPR
jgi:hypothetical protein